MLTIPILLLCVSASFSYEGEYTDEVENIWNELRRVKESFDFTIAKQEDKITRQEDKISKQEDRILMQREEIAFQNKKITMLQMKMMRMQQTLRETKYQHSSLGCVSDQLSLSCTNNSFIHVTYAEYGKYDQECSDSCCDPHPLNDCTVDVATSYPEDWVYLILSCENKTSCSYEYRGAVISECEIDYFADYMLIYYDCTPEPHEPVVGFTAFASLTRTYADAEIVIFDEIHSNFGGHYNPSTSTFSCPYHGTYLVSVSILTGFGSNMYAQIRKDDIILATGLSDNITEVYNQASALVVTECYPMQVLWIRSQFPGALYGSSTGHSTFSGYLLQRIE